MKRSEIEAEVKESGGGFDIFKVVKPHAAYFILSQQELHVLLLIITVIIDRCSET